MAELYHGAGKDKKGVQGASPAERPSGARSSELDLWRDKVSFCNSQKNCHKECERR